MVENVSSLTSVIYTSSGRVENAFYLDLYAAGFSPVVGSIILPDLASLKDRAIIDKLVQEEQIDKVITIEVKDVADKRHAGLAW